MRARDLELKRPSWEDTCMRRHAHVSSLLAIFATALACGGGGGSAGGGGQAEITVDNARTAASDVLAALMLTAGVGELGMNLLEEVTPSAAGAQAEPGDPMRALTAALHAASGVAVEPVPGLPGGVTPAGGGGPFDPITQDCEGGGSFTVSGSVAGPNPTTGDRVNASFADCALEVGDDPINGRFRYTVLSFTGDPQNLFSMILDLTFEDFGSEGDEIAVEIDGDAETTLSNTASPILLASAEGTSLRFRTEVEGNPDLVSSLTVDGYETIRATETDDGEYELTGDGQVSSSMQPPPEPPGTDYSGRLAYDVTDSLIGDTSLEVDNEEEQLERPGGGQIEVTGDDTAMRIDIVDETEVELFLDLDGDGIFPDDPTIETTWAELGF
jgi:hypothetical protein